jgi:hypothetical protein
MPRCNFGSVHSGPRDVGDIAIDMGNYVNVCAICADFKGFDDL